MKISFYISVPFLVGIAAAVHGSNSTSVGYDVGLGSFDFVASSATQINSTASTAERLYSPAGYEIGGSTKVAQDQKSWEHSLPIFSSSFSSPTRNSWLVEGRIALQVDLALDFESPNISQSKPWAATPRTNAVDGHSGLDHVNSSAARNGDYPPPKPPSAKSYGKRPWDPGSDCDDENSGFDGCLYNWSLSSMADSSFSTCLYEYLGFLAGGISTTPGNEEPENTSSWQSASIIAGAGAGAAFGLATAHSSDRKKKRRTSSGETITTSAKRAELRPAISEGHICNHCEASRFMSSRKFSGKLLNPLGNGEQNAILSNSGSIGQSETRPISLEQLVAELQGIYAGLVNVEEKCIAVDLESERHPNLSKVWKHLIDLHQFLFRKWHDLLAGAREKSSSPYTDNILYKYLRPIPSWYTMLGDPANNQMFIDAQDQQNGEIWIAIPRHWYSKTASNSTTEDSEIASDFEGQPELWHAESFNVEEHTDLESEHAKLGIKADSVDASVVNECKYEGSINPDFALSVSSQSDACGRTISSALDSLPFERNKNSYHPDFPYPLNVPDSISQRQLSTGSDKEALLESWHTSSSERNLMDPISMENFRDYLIDTAPDSQFEQDEEWLQSFVDLEMCSHGYSDLASDLASEVTSLEPLTDQPELRISSGSVAHAEIAAYVEPQLTVMSQWDQTDSELQEPRRPSILSSNTEIDGLKSLRLSPILHPPASLLDTPPLYVNPSERSASPRKGILKECHYCHKSFSLSELRKHIKYHTRPISCPEPDCEYSCANDHDLRRHHVTNHGVTQKHICPILDCNITFTRKDNLLRHTRRVHGNERKNDAEADLKV